MAASSSSASFTAYVAEPEFEDALEAELGLPGPTAPRSPRWPGLLTRPLSHPTPADPVFARQVLPQAQLVKVPAPAQLLPAVVEAIRARLDPGRAVAGVFVFTPHPQQYRSLITNLGPMEAGVKAALRAQGTSVLPSPAPAALCRAWAQGAAVLQVALVGHSSAVVSCGPPPALPEGDFAVAPWAAGLAPLKQDRQAPSRAYRKLEEAFAWLGRAPAKGETVVDLGGAPGGWAWTALKRGALVTAVDRSPLAPPAAGHPALTQIQGDAFAFTPPQPVNWLLCDVICAPPRSIELIERWASQGLCEHLVVTVKFKGATDNHTLVRPLATRLHALGFGFARTKHLHNNHNEVEVFASRPSASSQKPVRTLDGL